MMLKRLAMFFIYITKDHGSTFCCNESAWAMKEKLDTS